MVGEPTAGWIIYTWNTRLMDGTMLRLPRSRITDRNGAPMEMHPRPVDVEVKRAHRGELRAAAMRNSTRRSRHCSRALKKTSTADPLTDLVVDVVVGVVGVLVRGDVVDFRIFGVFVRARQSSSAS